MSIIYEALKKLENKPFTYCEDKAFLQKNSRNFNKLFWLLPAILGAIIFLSYGFFNRPRAARGASSAVWVRQNESALDKGLFFQKQELQKELNYRLEGVIFSENRPLAIINGETVREEDRLGNFLVTKISRDWVELSDLETQEKVTLFLDF